MDAALQHVDALVHGLRAMQFELAILLVIVVTMTTTATVIGLALWAGGVFDPPRYRFTSRRIPSTGHQIEKERA